MKQTVRILLILIAVVTVCMYGVSAGATSDDPADTYVRQSAPNEDASIDLWFDYSFNKTYTSDTESTGRDTFSIYMAKNEIESAQFVLYSETEHTGMKATVTDFTDGNGNTVPAEIYYEMYITTANVATDAVYGATKDTTIIREGETPDPVAPLAKVKTFKLNAGKSQAFLIRAKSAETTPAGWYSAQLNIQNSDGQTVKTATVYCHVWDFVISEKTEFRTSLYVDNDVSYGGSYQAFYDYLLENRLCAMDIPGGTVRSWNQYLMNDRVNAVRISETGNGSAGVTSYMDDPINYKSYTAIYNDLSNSPNWEKFKDKLYFYTADEPTSQEQQDAIRLVGAQSPGHTVDTVIERYNMLQQYWPGEVKAVVPFHENHPYPYYYYTKPLTQYSRNEVKDATEAMIESGACTIWCPQLYAFTPYENLVESGYTRNQPTVIRSLTATISGMYTDPSDTAWPYRTAYFDFDGLFGDFSDRIHSYMETEKEKGKNIELWTYRAGGNRIYSYCHHLIENSGLQTKMMFWQCYQEGITGYLYYDVNAWTGGIDRTPTGAKTNNTWHPGIYTYSDGSMIYGHGTLFYGPSMGKISGVSVIGSLRVELMRDGVEEYQMFKMLEDLKGNDAAQSIVGSVCNSVVDYISMPRFDRSGWNSSLSSNDIMEAARRQLGNELEAATLDARCEHEWSDGEVIEAAGCTTVGHMGYTCEKCGATKTEIIPANHRVEESFTKISGTPATCTEDGTEVYRCKYCSYEKTVTSTAFHNDPAHFSYKMKSETVHSVSCDVCGTVLSNSGHTLILFDRAPTCTEAGGKKTYCRYCEYEVVESEEDALGHNYVNGVCERCGEPEPEPEYMVGDLNGDKEITAIDSNLLKKAVAGTLTLGETEKKAADVSGDSEVTAIDANLMTKFVAGAISVFPAAVK